MKNKSKVVDKQNTRVKYGLVAGIIGIISNLVLFVIKLLIGCLSGSITIIADAINNLTDMGSSAMVVFGFKLSSKPADSGHPFGHARYEQIMALIISIFVMGIGLLLTKESVEKLIDGASVEVGVITYVILSIAIIIKIAQMIMYRIFASRINSDALKASSIDSRNDIVSTSAVLVAMIIIDCVGDISFSIDGLFGLLVSMFIIISSIKLIRETVSPLLGESQDKEFVKEIKDKIMSYEGVLGIHDFVIHSYGADNYFANTHVEVPSKMDFMLAHDLIDNIERDIKCQYNVSLSIHLDPIETDNKEVMKNKLRITKILSEFDSSISFHDLRIVFGETHNNVLFDVVLPFDSKLTLQDIKQELDKGYSKESKKHYFVITIDRE